MNDPNFKILGIKIPANLHTEFKIICAERNVSMAEVVTAYVVAFIEQAKLKPDEA